ncbi:hypothetical protein Slin15195_G047540 [Septoria linicola]|uniref:Uncharacterized protein n=1 Tax=Septoria linicola TaxID=215465 RepID=A0A9Q9EHX6_9PEZI|nr:hypothetical protein Slin14017_G051070 [Septoria linicola]USW51435.1 hypothetical protein Slin15195_G047540 [Septoria linicola]
MEVKEILNHGLTLAQADELLDKVVEFPEIDAKFERVRPITDFRKDDYEARVLYICRRLPSSSSSDDESQDNAKASQEELFILKCKVQAPSVLAGGLKDPVAGPSEHTTAELQALERFGSEKAEGLPHLIAWKKTAQMGAGWPMPGGYAVYVVMTMMPGLHLMDLGYWGIEESEREEIREKFLGVIQSVWRMGFEPYDTALRNILWERETKTLSIVDFEHWHPTTTDPINMHSQQEMQRWGLVKRPASTTHWEEWFLSEGLTRKR